MPIRTSISTFHSSENIIVEMEIINRIVDLFFTMLFLVIYILDAAYSNSEY